MSVVDAAFNHPLQIEEKATMPLAGGIANQGYQCGMLWGAALAAGAQAYELYGPGAQAETEALIATQKAVQAFQSRSKGEINCMEITEMNFQENDSIMPILKFFAKGGPIVCFRMAARYAPLAYDAIDAALLEERQDSHTASTPVSCTALLAHKLGFSEQHAVMAAGLAGGIGLSGGGCGALGAAIWLKGLKDPVQIEGISYAGTWVTELTENYLKAADYEFECENVVGRVFESPQDHAEYVGAGGCAQIIEALAQAI